MNPAHDSTGLPAGGLPRLILASTSRYRRELLERLQLPFDVVAPDIDEAPRRGELPRALALRLAREKAIAVSTAHPGAVVIGSDQVADLDGQPLGKPGHHAGAVRQLQAMSGRQVIFHTAVAVSCQQTGFDEADCESVQARFRVLREFEIERYLALEQPYDCAGSARAEGLGITLLSALSSGDPTAIIGLPLIRTCDLLRRAGIDPLGAASPRHCVDQALFPGFTP